VLGICVVVLGPGSVNKEWLHWRNTFDNFTSVLLKEGPDNLKVLTNSKLKEEINFPHNRKVQKPIAMVLTT